MSTEDAGRSDTADVDLKLEVVVIPVADVDRAKAFYGRLGWRLDADLGFDNGFRGVQYTPPGSSCSIQFGTKKTSAPAGSAQGLYLIVGDIEAARDALIAGGADVSEVFHPTSPGAQFEPGTSAGARAGLRRIARATARSQASATQTATAGCFRKSPPGWYAEFIAAEQSGEDSPSCG